MIVYDLHHYIVQNVHIIMVIFTNFGNNSLLSFNAIMDSTKRSEDIEAKTTEGHSTIIGK